MPVYCIRNFPVLQLKAYNRLEYENMLDDPAIRVDASSPHFAQPVAFAMHRFAYYQCHQCRQPYFGGRLECNDGMQEQGQQPDPAQRRCSACSGLGAETCAKHGKDFIQYKCRFCCGFGTFFCWGTTHFCKGMRVFHLKLNST